MSAPPAKTEDEDEGAGCVMTVQLDALVSPWPWRHRDDPESSEDLVGEDAKAGDVWYCANANAGTALSSAECRCCSLVVQDLTQMGHHDRYGM